MESIIDEKIYELSVMEENFDLVFDINQRYDSIIERLQYDFWNELVEYFKNKSQLKVNREDDWTITLRDQNTKYLRLFIQWETDESIIYGICTDNLKNKRQTNLIYNNLTNLDLLNDFDSENEDKIIDFFKAFNYDFSKLHGLKKMIPVNRTKMYEEFFDIFERFHEQIHPHLVELEKLILSE